MPSIPIANIPPKNVYIASASQTVFVYTYPIFAAEDLNVYLIPVGDAPDDLNQILQYNVDYTVTGVGVATGGTIVLSVGAATNDTIVIVRNMSDERLNYYINTAITADALNTDIESLVLMIQQNTLYNTSIAPHYNVDASPVPPTTNATGDLILPVLTANQVWVKDPTNTYILGFTLPTYPVGTLTPNVGTNNHITRWAGPQLLKDSGVSLLDNDYITGLVGLNLWQLPVADGSNGQSIVTNGAGVLSFGNPGSTSSTITQTAHGFVVGNLLRMNGTVYVLGQANNAANAEIIGIVSAVIDVNTFILTTDGLITGLSGLTAGGVYWLDPSTPGAYTLTEPSTPAQISKPVFIANTTTTAYYREDRGKIIPNAVPSTFSWVLITTNTSASPNTGYICNSGSNITVTLPTTIAVGQVVAVTNYGTGQFVLAQNAGQSIQVYSSTTTTGTGGSGTSLSQGTMVEVVCVVANTTFMVIDTEGYLNWV